MRNPISFPASQKRNLLENLLIGIYHLPLHRPRISIIGRVHRRLLPIFAGGSTRGNSRGGEGEDRQAGVVLERTRTGPFPPSFSPLFLRPTWSTRPNNKFESPLGGGVLASPAQIRGTMTITRNRADRARNLANDNLGRLHYLFPSPLPSIVNYSARCHCYSPPPINGSSVPFLLFSLSFFSFFCFHSLLLPRGSILVHRHPFHPVIFSLSTSLFSVFFFSFHRSIDVEQRRRMSGFISIDLGERAINDQRRVLLRSRYSYVCAKVSGNAREDGGLSGFVEVCWGVTLGRRFEYILSCRLGIFCASWFRMIVSSSKCSIVLLVLKCGWLFVKNIIGNNNASK